MSEVEPNTRQAELEERLTFLNEEIGSLMDISDLTMKCLERLGAPHSEATAEGGGDKSEPHTYLERMDDALERLASIRRSLEDHSDRLNRTI